MAKNPFRSAKTALRAQRTILNRDRNADFKVTQAGLGSIAANLQTTQAGLGTQLSRVNARGLEAMARIQGRSDARLAGIVSKGQKAIDNRFGSVIGADPNLLRGTKAVARSQGKVNAGQVKAGELQMRGANEALDILQQAGTNATASAQYELAQALAYRAKDDAKLIADQQSQLAQMKMQAQLQRQEYLWQQKQQQKQLEQAQLQGLGQITDSAPGALFDLQTALVEDKGVLKYTDENGAQQTLNVSTAQPGKVASILITQYGMPAEALPVLTKAVVYMQKQNMDPAAALTSAITQLYGDVKGFDKATAGLDKTLASGVLAAAQDHRAASAEAAQNNGMGASTDGNPRHVVVDTEGKQVRGPFGDIGIIQDDGSIKWLS